MIGVSIAQMAEARQSRAQDETVVDAVDAEAAPDAIGEAARRIDVFQGGVMEFVRAERLLSAGAPWSVRRLLQNDETASLRAVPHRHVGRDEADHLVPLAAPGNGAGQIHQAAALGIGRQAGPQRSPDLDAQSLVRRQRRGARLGETAAYEQAVAGRKMRVADGVEEDQFGAGPLERLQIVGVVEPERLVARDRNANIARMPNHGRDRRRRPFGRGCGDGRQAIQIDAEYAEAYRAGAQFPPVIVFYDGEHYWLADGYHRVEAARLAGRTEIYEDITPGSKRTAASITVIAAISPPEST